MRRFPKLVIISLLAVPVLTTACTGGGNDVEAKTIVYRILAFSLLAIMLAIFMALWRLALAYRRMLIKNRELFELIHRKQRREVRDIQRLARQTEQERTTNEQLFLRLVELMKKQQRYTDADLNRDMLAAMLGTNHRYIDDAIRECSDSPSTKAFIDGYRVDHAARLLTSTDDSIALIAEMSGHRPHRRDERLCQPHNLQRTVPQPLQDDTLRVPTGFKILSFAEC